MAIKDVSAATMYDVLHDGQYRKQWDPAMKESFDIARLSANADVGYYSCEDPYYLSDLYTFHLYTQKGQCRALIIRGFMKIMSSVLFREK